MVIENVASVDSKSIKLENQNGTDEDKQSKSLFAKVKQGIKNFSIRGLLAFFTVEPFLLCYIIPKTISALAIQQFYFEKACLADMNQTAEVCSKVLSVENDTFYENILKEMQTRVNDMTSWTTAVQSCIPAIAILFIGAWSDKTGNRKLVMLLPMFGEIVWSIGVLLSIYYFVEWPLWITGLIDAVPIALSGGFSVATMGAYSYVADVTTVESRTFRMGLVAILVTLSIPIGTAISGILTVAVGYYGVFGIGLAIYIIGFLHTLFRIKNVRKEQEKSSSCEKVVDFIHYRNIWNTGSVLFVKGARRRIKIFMIIIAYILIMGPLHGELRLQYSYFLKWYGMDLLDYSFFSTYSILLGIIGTLIAVTVFSKILKFYDATIGIIATACNVVSELLYGLAPNRDWLYAGPAFDLFGNTATTAIRSLATKVVDPEEIGKMCSIIGFVDAVVQSVATPVYNKIYNYTLNNNYFLGTFYILGSILTIPAFLIFWILYIMYRNDERNAVKHPEQKEMHTYENEITVL